MMLLTFGLVERVDHAAYSAVRHQARVAVGVALVRQRTYAGLIYKAAF
jgi:hypothetical protein